MVKNKVGRTREYVGRVLSNRLSVVEAIHDDDLFYETKAGKSLIQLKNHYHDIRHGGVFEIEEAMKCYSVGADLVDEVGSIVKEAKYLNKVSISISNDDYTCSAFRHLIENIGLFKNHVDDVKLSKLLDANESLLKILYHSDELGHLTSNVHEEDFMKNHSFDSNAIGSAVFHYLNDGVQDYGMFSRVKSIIFGNKSDGERISEVVNGLHKRSEWLVSHAKWVSIGVIRSRIKKLESRRKYWKKKTAKIMKGKIKHFELLDEFYKEFGDKK